MGGRRRGEKVGQEGDLWNFFQNAVVEREPSTFEEFKDTLVSTWWDISQEYIRNLYRGMDRRVRRVLEVDGKPTKY